MKRQSGHRDEIHYISIRQPFAWLIMEGIKDIENRGRPSHYRGELFIHASSNPRNVEEDLKWVEDEFGIKVPEDELQYGGFIGSVEMTDCVTESDSDWFSSGEFGYVLENPTPIKLVSYKANAGMQRAKDIQVTYLNDSSQPG